jgi:HEAT repeat protein
LKESNPDFNNNEPQPNISGGPRRPSRKVDGIGRFPLIRRRIELDRMLMENSCAVQPGPTIDLTKEDLPILVQIALEKGENANPLLRKQAIRYLRQFRSVEALEQLLRIFLSSSEDESIRGQALISITDLSPTVATFALQSHLIREPLSLRQYTPIALNKLGENDSLLLLDDLKKITKDKIAQNEIRRLTQSIKSKIGVQHYKASRKRVVRPLIPKPDQSSTTSRG